MEKHDYEQRALQFPSTWYAFPRYRIRTEGDKCYLSLHLAEYRGNNSARAAQEYPLFLGKEISLPLEADVLDLLKDMNKLEPVFILHVYMFLSHNPEYQLFRLIEDLFKVLKGNLGGIFNYLPAELMLTNANYRKAYIRIRKILLARVGTDFPLQSTDEDLLRQVDIMLEEGYLQPETESFTDMGTLRTIFIRKLGSEIASGVEFNKKYVHQHISFELHTCPNSTNWIPTAISQASSNMCSNTDHEFDMRHENVNRCPILPHTYIQIAGWSEWVEYLQLLMQVSE